jgi:putative tricarboxylic transport membrane protein
MRLSDTFAGLLIGVVGIAIVIHAMAFPPMPGQPIGPSAFPVMIGSCLTVLGAILGYTGARTRGASWVELEEWIRRPRMVLNFGLVIASLLFYSFAVDQLGFFITAFVFLSALFVAFGVRRIWIAPVALVATIVIHFGFYTLLRVPLPWGVLEAIAW